MKPQRLDIAYCIVWNGRWHTGSGYGSLAVDRVQQRDRSGSPVIPGAHIKGAVRHQLERLARSLGLKVVDPHASAVRGNRELIKNFQPLRKSDLLVDRLFGSRYQGECLFVSNAVPENSRSAAVTPVVTRTAIDRVTGTVKERHLFTTEVVGGSTLHAGTIRCRHPSGVLTQEEDSFPLEYSLLVAALLSVDALGGEKSAGLGRCEVKLGEDALRWNDQSIPVDTALKSLYEREWADYLEIVREENAS